MSSYSIASNPNLKAVIRKAQRTASDIEMTAINTEVNTSFSQSISPKSSSKSPTYMSSSLTNVFSADPNELIRSSFRSSGEYSTIVEILNDLPDYQVTTLRNLLTLDD
jgi:hypothetical protein